MSEPGLLVGRKTRQPTASVNLAKNQSRERRQFRQLDPTLPVPQSFAPPERIQHHLIQDVLVRNPSYSITSSARASSVGGISRPSAFAVLRLITNWNLVGCTTGISAGLVPLRMRPTLIPALRYASAMLGP